MSKSVKDADKIDMQFHTNLLHPHFSPSSPPGMLISTIKKIKAQHRWKIAIGYSPINSLELECIRREDKYTTREFFFFPPCQTRTSHSFTFALRAVYTRVYFYYFFERYNTQRSSSLFMPMTVTTSTRTLRNEIDVRAFFTRCIAHART